MSIQFNDPGEPTVGTLQVHDHPCSLYETQKQLKQQFVPYLQAGLALGEKCVYFVDENTEQFVIEAMQEDGFDLKPYLRSGQFEVIHTRDAHLHSGHFGEEKMLAYWNQALDGAKASGFTALRAAVEMTWALSGLPGCEILAPYEARLTNLMREKDASVICMYSRKKFSPEKIKAVIHAHPLVVTDDTVLVNAACPAPEKFVEGCPNLDVQAILDNLTLIQKLSVANRELSIKKEEYEALYSELQQLAKVVSHEMQGPLSQITSYLRLLTVRYRDKLGPDADEFMETMNEGAVLLLRMIDDLWNYARVDSGEQTHQSVHSLQILGEALDDVKEVAEVANADIVLSEMPTIHCNPRNLRFVFKALIENACRYGRLSTRPRVEIGAREFPHAWQFEVKDNGKGIDAIHTSEVFKIYRRLEGKPGRDGTGMGLAIAKRMLEQEGGKIWFESQVGEGTTFYFSLPKTAAEQKIAYLRDFKHSDELRQAEA